MQNDVKDVLRRLDLSELTLRECRLLMAVQEVPGQSGQDLSDLLGIAARSGVQNAIVRLVKKGFLNDTREAQKQAVPCRCYITPAGEEYLKGVLQ